MSGDRRILEKTVGNALSGKGAHVETKNLFAGLNWKVAGTRPEGGGQAPRTCLNKTTCPAW